MNRYIQGVSVLICSILMMGCASAQSAGKSLPGNTDHYSTAGLQSPKAVPSGLRLNVTASGVHLAWSFSSATQATGFEIVRATLMSGPYSPVATVEGTGRSYTDRTAAPEHIYFYKVRALTTGGPSDFSVPAVAEISGNPGK